MRSMIAVFQVGPQNDRTAVAGGEERDGVALQPPALVGATLVAGELEQLGGGQEHQSSPKMTTP